MRNAFTIVELLVVLCISIILAGMLIPAINMVYNSAEKQKLAKKGTTATSDPWKTSENKTPSGPVQTYIITNPETNQMWLVVSRNSNNVAIIPYTPPATQVEATH